MIHTSSGRSAALCQGGAMVPAARERACAALLRVLKGLP
jgi:hypothetical protein